MKVCCLSMMPIAVVICLLSTELQLAVAFAPLYAPKNVLMQGVRTNSFRSFPTVLSAYSSGQESVSVSVCVCVCVCVCVRERERFCERESECWSEREGERERDRDRERE